MALDAYLNDHLAGATAGCDLVAHLEDRFRGTPHGVRIAALRTAIEADKTTLAALMAELGVVEQRLKQAVGWLGEKVTRAKLSDAVGGRDLAPLLAMETLASGILAKAAMWENLRALAGTDPRLRAAELDHLVERATAQLDDLRRERVAYATEVLLAEARA